MSTSNTEGRYRLSVIQTLYRRIQASYDHEVPLSWIAEQTGIPQTNLHKWLHDKAIPREASFKTAEAALLAFLNGQAPIQASADLRPHRAPQRPARPNARLMQTYIGLGVVIGLAFGLAIGALIVALIQ